MAHLPPDQQLEALGQQVGQAAAIKQQQLMQLKGAVTAAAAAGLAGGNADEATVAKAAESAAPFEAMLVAQLQEIGTFVHQLATCQQSSAEERTSASLRLASKRSRLKSASSSCSTVGSSPSS